MPDRKQLADAVRALSMDAVQAANSGHPGMPMGMADIAEVLWNDFLKHNPNNPDWPDRDRVVISNGHGSMLLYSVLHLTGYALPIEELRNFRQLHSKTAGHPEAAETPGVETTTGPLGQGLANAVGMALAEKLLAQRFNRQGHAIVDHFTYVFAGDGCLMEGISHEACSLAGTLGLGKLIVVYDDNGISIDGEVRDWFTDDTPSRFRAYGWGVIPNVDGHDPDAVRAALEQARADQSRPTLICCRTVIGCGAPNKQGTADTHGAPLGADEVAAARVQLGWTHAPFEIPDEIYRGWDARARGGDAEAEWRGRLDAYASEFPREADELKRRLAGKLPAEWAEHVAAYIADAQAKGANVASRKASGMALEAIGPLLPELIGGSADLTGSNNTRWSGSVSVNSGDEGNYIYYGVREFGMSAIASGLALQGGFVPYAGTFLVFSDYARNALRMSALIPTHAIWVYTHDSIGLGEDGPTHQPIEHLGGLRMMPNLALWRPCDTVETAVAWQAAIERNEGPTALVLSRQGLPHQHRDPDQVAAIARGGYVLLESQTGALDAIVIATGSEVGIAMDAGRELNAAGVGVRVVSMPSTQAFDAQPLEYREAVLPRHTRARIAVEAATPDYWRKYVGLDGAVVGIDRFGASAPAKDLFREYGFTSENIAATVKAVIEKTG